MRGRSGVCACALAGALWLVATEALAVVITMQEHTTLSNIFVRDVVPADLDGDLDLDLLIVAGSQVEWYENTDGQGSFGPAQLLVSSASAPSSHWAQAADLDGDHDLDVLTIGDPSLGNLHLGWLENLDGAGSFGPRRQLLGEQPIDGRLVAGDLDGDDDVDLAALFPNYDVAWLENLDGLGTFAPRVSLSNPAGNSDANLSGVDLDGDGDLDLLASGYNPRINIPDCIIGWYASAGDGTFAPFAVLDRLRTSYGCGVELLGATDVDGDGRQDLFAQWWYIAGSGAKITALRWYRATAAAGVFEAPVVVSSDGAVQDACGADLDRDGDQDLLLTSYTSMWNGNGYVFGGHVQWLENLDGLGTFRAAQNLTPAVNAAQDIAAVHIDADASLDVLYFSDALRKVAWLSPVSVDFCAPSSPCLHDGVCSSGETGFTCDCTATGYSGATCQADIDECALGGAGCHADAQCLNSPGSFACACRTGFTGDGVSSCDDVDECASATDDCDANASCSNTAGSFDCACDPGYVGDGHSCALVPDAGGGEDAGEMSDAAGASDAAASHDASGDSDAGGVIDAGGAGDASVPVDTGAHDVGVDAAVDDRARVDQGAADAPVLPDSGTQMHDSAGGDRGGQEAVADTGCGCDASTRPGATPWLLLAALGAGWRRRARPRSDKGVTRGMGSGDGVVYCSLRFYPLI